MSLEIWKSVYKEGNKNPLYFVSSHGRVKSVRYVWNKKINNRFKKEKIMSELDNSQGYKFVYLYNKGERRKVYIHILVARAFLNIPFDIDKPEVDHLDGNRGNNKIDNLEFVSHRENCKRRYNRHDYKGEL